MTFSKFAHRNFTVVFMPLNGQPPARCLTMTSGNTKEDSLLDVSDEMQRIERTYEASACFLTAEEGKADF